MTVSSHSRPSGLPAVEHLPWGSHFCQFYSSRSDLVETLVPYFSAGLRNNEACLWITSFPLEAGEARDLMVRAAPDFAEHLAKGQIEIHDLSEWYLPGQRFDADDVMNSWIEREERARRRGFAGLRLTGNTFWLERMMWDDFMEYEHKVNTTFGRHRILALCTYCLDRCSAEDVIDVVRNHEFALTRRQGTWELIESASLKTAKESLARVNQDLESRVVERTQELQDAIRGRDQFLAMLAHELRNPLAPIRSAAHVVRLLSPANDDLGTASAVLERQVSHMSRLVDDLLDTARITRGAITLKREVVDAASLLARSLESAQPNLSARRHALVMTLPSEELSVEVDPTRIEQVIGNLLDNAAKYTPEGGNIEVSATREGDDAVLRVKDDGMGIEPQMLGRIFDLFAQANTSTDRPTGGLGLGLALVKTLVEMHGGRVEARSDGLGTGAEFIVRIPVAGDEPERQAARSPEDGEDRLRVLVVDDNHDACDTLALTLELIGHEVEVAHDGEGALRVAERLHPDVVLLDIGLPGIDGYEVARRLRRLPEVRHARLVALTGYGRAEDRRRGEEAGFDAYFVKPISPSELRDVVTARTFH